MNRLPLRLVGDVTGAVTPQENVLTPLNEASQLDQAEAADSAAGPIALPWYQSAYQTVLQATGQLNADGTGAGNGFWTSPGALGLYAVGGIVAIGFLLESPVLAAALGKGDRK